MIKGKRTVPDGMRGHLDMNGFHDYTGVIHIHSSYSYDGRVPVRDIIKAAQENHIDFIMITDHESLRAKQEGLEGWHGDTLLIVGQEIAPRFNHYLAFGIDKPLRFSEDDPDISVSPQAYIDEVRALGGMGFIAHPDHEGTELFHVKHYPWLDWSVTGYTGMGIWDFMSDWQSSLNSFLKSLVSYCFPALFLRGPKAETLRRWDRLNEVSQVVGLGELDNHDTLAKVFGFNFTVFPFGKALRFVRTHLLLNKPLSGNAREDVTSLLNALQKGRAYFSQEYFRQTKGFSFKVADNDKAATMGDEFILNGEAFLKVHLPARAKIRIIRDGLLCHGEKGTNFSLRIDRAGNFRVEVYLKFLGKYRPWIFSNPVYVKNPDVV